MEEVRITTVSVFSTYSAKDVFIGYELPDVLRCKWYEMSLTFYRKIELYDKIYNEYRISDWQKTFPTELKECRLVAWQKDETGTYHNTVYLSEDDNYGYIGGVDADGKSIEPEHPNFRDGFSVREGDDFFVNFLTAPSIWMPKNHSEHCVDFKKDVINFLLVLKKINVNLPKDMIHYIIIALAQTYVLTSRTCV